MAKKKTRSLSDLREEAQYGQLTNEEINSVIQRIKESKPEDEYNKDNDLYTLLYILGMTGLTEHRKLMESFLHYPSDPMISRIALLTLCRYWNLTADYLETLKAFIKGVNWDEDDDVRLVAMTTAAKYLIENKDKELLQSLLDVFENLGKSNSIRDCDTEGSREFIQGCAYHAIATAMGRQHQEINDPEYVMMLLKKNQLDMTPVIEAKALLSNVKGN